MVETFPIPRGDMKALLADIQKISTMVHSVEQPVVVSTQLK